METQKKRKKKEDMGPTSAGDRSHPRQKFPPGGLGGEKLGGKLPQTSMDCWDPTCSVFGSKKGQQTRQKGRNLRKRPFLNNVTRLATKKKGAPAFPPELEMTGVRRGGLFQTKRMRKKKNLPGRAGKKGGTLRRAPNQPRGKTREKGFWCKRAKKSWGQ